MKCDNCLTWNIGLYYLFWLSICKCTRIIFLVYLFIYFSSLFFILILNIKNKFIFCKSRWVKKSTMKYRSNVFLVQNSTLFLFYFFEKGIFVVGFLFLDNNCQKKQILGQELTTFLLQIAIGSQTIEGFLFQ